MVDLGMEDAQEFLLELSTTLSFDRLIKCLKRNESLYKNVNLLQCIANNNGVAMLLKNYSHQIANLNEQQPLLQLTIQILNFLINITYKEDTIRYQVWLNEKLLICMENFVLQAKNETLFRKYSKMIVNVFSSGNTKLLDVGNIEFIERYFMLTNNIILLNYNPDKDKLSHDHYIHEIFISWIKILLYNKPWIKLMANIIDFNKYNRLSHLHLLHENTYRYLKKLLNLLLNTQLFSWYNHIIAMNLIKFIMETCSSNPECNNHSVINHSISCGGDKCLISIPFVDFFIKLLRTDELFNQMCHTSNIEFVKNFISLWYNVLTQVECVEDLTKSITQLIYPMLLVILSWCNHSSIRFHMRRCSLIETIIRSISIDNLDMKYKCILAKIVCSFTYDSDGIPLVIKLNSLDSLISIMEQFRNNLKGYEPSCSETLNGCYNNNNSSEINVDKGTNEPNLKCSSPLNFEEIEFSNTYSISVLHTERQPTQCNDCGSTQPTTNLSPIASTESRKRPLDLNNNDNYIDGNSEIISTFQSEMIVNRISEFLLRVLRMRYYQPLINSRYLLRVVVENVTMSTSYSFVKYCFNFLRSFIEESCTFRANILKGLPYLIAQYSSDILFINGINMNTLMTITLKDFFQIKNGIFDTNFFINSNSLSLLETKYNLVPTISCPNLGNSSSHKYGYELLRIYSKKATQSQSIYEIYDILKSTCHLQLFHTSLAIPILYNKSFHLFNISQITTIFGSIIDSMSNPNISLYYFNVSLLSLSYVFKYKCSNLDLPSAVLQNSIKPISKYDTNKFVYKNQTCFDKVKTIYILERTIDTNDSLEPIGKIMVDEESLMDSSLLFNTLLNSDLDYFSKKLYISVESLPGYDYYIHDLSYQFDVVFHFLHLLHGCPLRSSCTINTCDYISIQHQNYTNLSANKRPLGKLFKDDPTEFFFFCFHVLILCDKYICNKAIEAVTDCFQSVSFGFWLLSDYTKFCSIYNLSTHFKIVPLQRLLIYYLFTLDYKLIEKLKILLFITQGPFKSHFFIQLAALLELMAKLHTNCICK